jgi:hypothetical protein
MLNWVAGSDHAPVDRAKDQGWYEKLTSIRRSGGPRPERRPSRGLRDTASNPCGNSIIVSGEKT